MPTSAGLAGELALTFDERAAAEREIAQEMTTSYDVTLEHAQSSVAAALGALATHHLVRPD